MRSTAREYLGVRGYVCPSSHLRHMTDVSSYFCTISTFKDLTPLAYVAGTVADIRNIRVFDGPRVFGAREVVSCKTALERHHIEPLPLLEKENLGIMNGTAFSASVASLALYDAVHLALLAQVCTAMGTEALLGVRANYDPFIHEVARPHPGQVCLQNSGSHMSV